MSNFRLLLILMATFFSASARAQLGTFHLDFDGFADSFLGDNVTNTIDVETNVFDLGGFSNILDTPANRAGVKAGIFNELDMIFADKDIKFTDRAPANGNFSTIGVGARVAGPEFKGFSETLDFLNKKKDDNAVVFTDITARDVPAATTVGDVARALANVIGHEAAHLLGVKHNDAIAAGNKTTFVNHPNNSSTAKNTIDPFSMFKLDLASNGATTTSKLGVGNTINSAEDVSDDLNHDGVVLVDSYLQPEPDDVDLFKFTLAEKASVTIETFSSTLRYDPARQDDFADSILTLLDQTGGMVAIPAANTFDNERDDLMFSVALNPGTYFAKVSLGDLDYDNGYGDTGTANRYELLITNKVFAIPEPSFSVLLWVAFVSTLSCRRTRSQHETAVA